MTLTSPLSRTPVWAFALICLLSSAVGLFIGGILGAAISDLASMPASIIILTALAGALAPPALLISARRNGDSQTGHPDSTSAFGENNAPPPENIEKEPGSDFHLNTVAKNGTYRIIDWWRIGKATLNCSIYLFASLIFAGAAPHLLLTALAIGTALFVCWIIAHLMGVVFDLDTDQLRYPSFVLRRRIPLSSITDANAQVVVRSLMSTIANGIGSGPRSRPNRQYAVNLSGEFETRQLRFASRKRRDQFLSLLRRYCPRARITRWTDWG